MSGPKRYEQGKHLTLVNKDYLSALSNLQGDVIGPAAAWYELCDEARWLIEKGKLPVDLLDSVNGVQAFLDRSLDLSRSVNSRGLETLARVLQAQEEAQIHRDAGQFVPQPQEQRGGFRS